MSRYKTFVHNWFQALLVRSAGQETGGCVHWAGAGGVVALIWGPISSTETQLKSTHLNWDSNQLIWDPLSLTQLIWDPINTNQLNWDPLRRFSLMFAGGGGRHLVNTWCQDLYLPPYWCREKRSICWPFALWAEARGRAYLGLLLKLNWHRRN